MSRVTERQGYAYESDEFCGFDSHLCSLSKEGVIMKTKAEIEKILKDNGVSFDDMMAVGYVPHSACPRCDGRTTIELGCQCMPDWDSIGQCRLGICYEYCRECRGTGKRKQ